jgi:hypothetical protein
MAELTVNTERDPDVLTEDELDSLRVGEELQAEQQDMLAGKFRDAEELEKAYMELQQKLGQPREESTPEPEEEEESQVPADEEPELTEVHQLISEASQEYYANEGTISPEMMDKLSSMDAKDLVQTYMEMQAINDSAPDSAPDLTDREVMEIQSMAGGADEYSQMTSWASENLPSEDVEAFDSLIATGQMGAIRLAVAGLRSIYSEKVGYEGRMLSGKAATESVDAFRSQAEVVRAMQDPRYDSDPAYRNDVFNKLDRSNLDW